MKITKIDKEAFIKMLKDSPEYMWINAMCYCYHNNKGCSNCPLKDKCDNTDEKFLKLKEKN